MTTDGVTPVQTPEQVSAPVVTEPVQLAPQPTPTPVAAEPLTKEVVAKMVEEATAKVLAAAKEQGKRELQSAQDRNKADLLKAERKAKIAESTLSSAQARLAQVDPDAARELKLAVYEEQAKGLTAAEQEEQAQSAQMAFHKSFMDSLNQSITSLGVDPADTRIDWNVDGLNYFDAQKKILGSTGKIIQEKLQSVSALEKRLKDLEGKANQANKEVNSVSTSTSQGVVAGSDAEFIKKFGEGELPVTKANMDRYKKIKATY